MYKLFFIAFIILFCCHCNLRAEKNIHFVFKRSIELKIAADKPITYTTYRNTLYYAQAGFDVNNEYNKKTKDSIRHKFYTLDMATQKSDSFFLYFPRNNAITLWSLRSIAVTRNLMALSFDSIYIFNNKKYKNKLESFGNNGMQFISQNILFIYKNYNSHPKDDLVDNKFILYNIENKKIISFTKPEFNYVGYTHMVHNFVEILNNRIFFSQTIPYKITIFSAENLKPLYTILGSELPNASDVLEKIDSVHKIVNISIGIKELIYTLRGLDSINRIEKIALLDENTLLVSRTFPNGKWEKRILDVWKYNAGKWSQIIYNQIYETEKNYDYMVTENTLPIDLTLSDKLITENEYIYTINNKINPYLGENKSQSSPKIDNFYADHPLNYYLWQYTWKIN